MTFIELEQLAGKCFKDFSTYYKERTAFIEDYQFFEMYMKRNAKSDIRLLPKAELRSLQSVIDNYSHDERGLERAFCIYNIVKQIVTDLQEWNTPVFGEAERNETLQHMVKHEWVNIDVFCNDFIGCSSVRPEIRAKIDEIVNFETT